MSSSKTLTCKGTLRQVFVGVSSPSNLISGSTLSPSPLPCVNKYTVYTYRHQSKMSSSKIIEL